MKNRQVVGEDGKVLNLTLFTKTEERKKGDDYAKQLLESHKLRFSKYIALLPIKIRQRLQIRYLYEAVINQKNIYNYYDVDVAEFTMAMIQGKLTTVARNINTEI